MSAAPAVQRTVVDSEEFSGRLEATEYVELRPRVSGTIEKIHFIDGAFVQKGQLLFTIDPRPFEAEAARAQSQLAVGQGHAPSWRRASWRGPGPCSIRRRSRARSSTSWTSGTRTSQADIQGAEAALRTARLNLEYTQVRAPIAGRASRANITVGNLVNEQSVLTSIAGVSKVYAYFDGSEQTYLRLRGDDKASDRVPKVKMGLANEQGFPHAGQVDFIDNRLNPQTGAIRMRATFDNAKGQLHARPRARGCAWKARAPTRRCSCPTGRSAPTRPRSSSSSSAPAPARRSSARSSRGR